MEVKIKKRLFVLLLIPCLILNFSITSFADSLLPKKKQTVLGLYVITKEAFSKWNVAPNKVKILDVRTQGEYIFVGHAPMAINIPLKIPSGIRKNKCCKQLKR